MTPKTRSRRAHARVRAGDFLWGCCNDHLVEISQRLFHAAHRRKVLVKVLRSRNQRPDPPDGTFTISGKSGKR